MPSFARLSNDRCKQHLQLRLAWLRQETLDPRQMKTVSSGKSWLTQEKGATAEIAAERKPRATMIGAAEPLVQR